MVNDEHLDSEDQDNEKAQCGYSEPSHYLEQSLVNLSEANNDKHEHHINTVSGGNQWVICIANPKIEILR